ncbi:MAG: sensor histidine kinase [Paracoccaceae bacterium]
MTEKAPSRESGGPPGAGPRGAEGRSLPARGLRVYIAILLAVAIAPIGAVGVIQTVIAQRENDALRIEAYVNDTIEATAAQTRIIATAFGTLATLGQILPLERDDCALSIGRVADAQPHVDTIAVFDPDGRLVCASDPQASAASMGAGALAEAVSRSRRPVVAVPEGGQAVLHIAHPLFDGGAYAGFVALNLPQREVTLFWPTPGKRAAGRREAMFDEEGRVVARTATLGGPGSVERVEWLPPPDTLVAWADETGERAYEYIPADGVERTYVALPIVEGALYALVGWPSGAAESAAATRLLLAVLFPLAMWVVGIAIAFFAVNTLLLRNVLRLARVMGAFARGRRSVRMQPADGAPTEILALSETFNRLADRLEADERAMGEAIEEKNTLLKEVYHRVKNNLQLIVSMMNLQIRQAASEEEREALRRLQGRVQGLALVHQRLYQASSLAAVRMDLLLEDLTRRLREVQRLDQGEVELSMHSEPIALEADRAVPVALFASEAIENAFKHGIGAARGGRLAITLTSHEEGMLHLSIGNTVAAGNGGANPDGLPWSRQGRLGTRLLEAFARQLGGTLARESRQGWHEVMLDFPLAREGAAPGVSTGGPFADAAHSGTGTAPSERRSAGGER